MSNPRTLVSATVVLLALSPVAGCSSQSSLVADAAASLTCTAGTKTPVRLARRSGVGAWASAANIPARIAIGDTELFWAQDSKIVRTVKAGGSSSDFVGVGVPTELMLDGPRLVFSDSGVTPGVFTVQLSGTTTSNVAAGSPPIFVVGAGKTYWVDHDGMAATSAVRARGTDGGVVQLVYGPVMARIDRLAIDGDTLIIAEHDGAAKVLRLPLGGGAPVELARRQGYGTTAMAVGDGSVVWLEGSNRLWWVAMAGGSTQALVEDPSAYLTAPSIMGGFVYTTDAAHGQVLRVPLAGGAREVLANVQTDARALALDATCMYWLTSDPSGDGGADAALGDVHLMAMARP